jgi:hypothetical protein
VISRLFGKDALGETFAAFARPEIPSRKGIAVGQIRPAGALVS